MADERWQVISLIPQFPGVGYRPQNHDRLGHKPNRCILRNDQQAGTRPALRQTQTKMVEHRPPVMGNDDPGRCCGTLQHFRIANPMQSRLRRRSEIDRRFAPPHGREDVEVQIGVRLEPKAQGRSAPIFARARWTFSHSAGSACSMGIPLASNSRADSSKYRSTSAL